MTVGRQWAAGLAAPRNAPLPTGREGHRSPRSMSIISLRIKAIIEKFELSSHIWATPLKHDADERCRTGQAGGEAPDRLAAAAGRGQGDQRAGHRPEARLGDDRHGVI